MDASASNYHLAYCNGRSIFYPERTVTHTDTNTGDRYTYRYIDTRGNLVAISHVASVSNTDPNYHEYIRQRLLHRNYGGGPKPRHGQRTAQDVCASLAGDASG